MADLASIRRAHGHPNYKPHCDAIGGFRWEADLVRLGAAPPHVLHRLRLRLVETLEVPCFFAVLLDHRGPVGPYTEVVRAAPVQFAEARAAFESAFRDKVGYGWDERHNDWLRVEGRWSYVTEEEKEEARG